MSTSDKSTNGLQDTGAEPVFDLRDIPGGVKLAVPERYAAHPLVCQRTFYTLPVALLDQRERRPGRDAFDQQLFDMERALSEQLKPIPAFVGFDRGQAIEHAL